MNKTINYIFFLLLLSSCAYEPILKNKNYGFSINVDKINGDQKINSVIVKNFNNLKGTEKIYDLTISSTKEKNIISKDSKGDPSVFELIINVNYRVEKDGKTLIVNKINRRTTHNNITDKFELENYEKNIINQLSKSASDKIINSISEIHE
jgi:outer membrane lipopolysaccharide assembly protein LptE/RlpB